MEIPRFNVGMSHNGFEFNFIDYGLDRLYTILGHQLMRFYGFPVDAISLGRINAFISELLIYYMDQGFVKKIDNMWDIDMVRLVVDDLNWHIDHGELISNNRCFPGNFHAEALLDINGELCLKLKSYPGAVIEKFKNLLSSDKFNNAFELYRNEYILSIANIGEMKNV